MMKLITLLLSLLINLSLFGQTKKMSDAELKNYAVALAHKYIIVDTHVDLPTALLEKKYQSGKDNQELIATKKGDFDFTRAREGGLAAPFMSIYVPAAYQKKPDMGKAFADSLIDMVRSIPLQLPGNYALAGNPAVIRKNFASGKISLPMGMENGAPVGTDLKNVRYFFDRGIRYITLTHGKDNQICDSSYDSVATWHGLSPFGRKVVIEMNTVGIMVDISHVSDSAFYQVIRMTKIPVIASHSSCRIYTPSFTRNMSDDMIRMLGKNGGVIQISFGSLFIDQAWKTSKKFADVQDVVKHIDHVVKLIGVDHVGFGSDFDGVGDSLPVGLKDVSMYPNIIYGLLKLGYKEGDIEKICGGNILRVWQQVLNAAKAKG